MPQVTPTLSPSPTERNREAVALLRKAAALDTYAAEDRLVLVHLRAARALQPDRAAHDTRALLQGLVDRYEAGVSAAEEDADECRALARSLVVFASGIDPSGLAPGEHWLCTDPSEDRGAVRWLVDDSDHAWAICLVLGLIGRVYERTETGDRWVAIVGPGGWCAV